MPRPTAYLSISYRIYFRERSLLGAKNRRTNESFLSFVKKRKKKRERMINHTTKKFLSHRENKVNKNPLEKETNVMANDGYGTSLNEVKGSRATTFRVNCIYFTVH